MNEIILPVGYRADAIVAHFEYAYYTAVVSYAAETVPLETGGVIVHTLCEKGDDSVLVLNGDTFLDIDYNELFRWCVQSPTHVAMVLSRDYDCAQHELLSIV